MTGRRAVLLGGVVAGIIAAAVGMWSYRSAHRAPSGCDTVHALIAYNTQFTEKMKSSAGTGKAATVTPEQYRQWAARVKDYASQISDPQLAGKAGTAADLAGRLADLVPRYRANPDDADAVRDYAGIGIEYGNAINRLDYSCLPGS